MPTKRKAPSSMKQLSSAPSSINGPRVLFEKIHPDAKLPVYATDGSSGADIFAVEPSNIYGIIAAQNRWAYTRIQMVNTGLRLAYIDPGYEIQVRPKSGLASKGLIVVNSPGTVDNDYRGEIKVIMLSINENYVFQKGDKIAQVVVVPVSRANFGETTQVSTTKRGAGGFGSTGK